MLAVHVLCHPDLLLYLCSLDLQPALSPSQSLFLVSDLLHSHHVSAHQLRRWCVATCVAYICGSRALHLHSTACTLHAYCDFLDPALELVAIAGQCLRACPLSTACTMHLAVVRPCPCGTFPVGCDGRCGLLRALPFAAMPCNLSVAAGIASTRFYYSGNDFPSSSAVYGCWGGSWCAACPALQHIPLNDVFG